MKKNKKLIELELMRLMFYSRGSIDINSVYEIDRGQRELMAEVIEEYYSKLNGGTEELLISN
jgi:hypothetical protein